MEGVVHRVVADRGFGFVRENDKRSDAFFHFKDLTGGLVFDDKLVGTTVEYSTEETAKGVRARNIRPAP